MDEDFFQRMHAAAVRARASGFDSVADAIEGILKKELEALAERDVASDAATRPPKSVNKYDRS